ncbi:hypothetical protein ACFYO0_29010 [Streptomyces sp. NPDC006365]|uniref:hypothetical protein n=1 Tax=Streptomyces sp. NPDC006365 TaxID=3364744 RepID=UPI0036831B5E
MRRYSVALLAAAATAGLVMTGAPSASAAAQLKSCSTSDGGASGGMQWNWTSKKTMDVALILADTEKDGAWVRIRLDITTGAGNRYSYGWRELHDGNGSNKTWTTTATHASGIVSARVQVENVKGSSPLATCYSGKAYNDYY